MSYLKEISVAKTLKTFNSSDFRRKSIPMELGYGWPAIIRCGKMLCITIPYYRSIRNGTVYDLYPPVCSVTVPLGNPDRILDFTMYPYEKGWQDVDFGKPAGTFKHDALAGVKKEEYGRMKEQLYAYYDEMVQAVSEKKPFEGQKQMTELFAKLMEPGLYPYYVRINQKFYSSLGRPAE